MNNLPAEVLINIFKELSQRNMITICTSVCRKWNDHIKQPWAYTHIHIYSKKQLKNFIQMAKKKKINNRRIINYVKSISLQYRCEPWDNDIVDFLVFPHLQSILGLIIYHETPNINKSIYLELQQPTDFAYWYYNERWIYKLNDIKQDLTSLNIHITDALYNFIPDQSCIQPLPPTTEMIYLKTIGKDSIINNSDLNDTVLIKLLHLPTSFIHLRIIKIHFHNDVQRAIVDKYRINELTIENIHQSCPQLESLTLEEFVMTISNDYHSRHINKEIIPTQLLKKLEIVNGKFVHPSCFSYFNTKYPTLTSLNMNFYFKGLLLSDSISFQDAIFKMILGFPLLKKIAFGSNSHFQDFFPCTQFIKWLYQNCHQITHLAYISDFIMNNNNNNNNGDNIHHTSLIQLQPQQPTFLNHITCLALCLDRAFEFVYTYLLQNTSTTEIPSIVKELKIIGFVNNRVKDIYIYDWLTLFPNLTTLMFQNVSRIRDQVIDHDISSDYNDNRIDDRDEESFQLHQLIKNRRESKKNTFNQLTYLSIKNCKLWFKNGLDVFLRNCHSLLNLDLQQTTLIVPTSSSINQLHLDLSTLHLKSFFIKFIYCASCDDPNYTQRAFKITLHESLYNSKRVFKTLRSQSYRYTLELYIKCKYIDGFIHSL